MRLLLDYLATPNLGIDDFAKDYHVDVRQAEEALMQLARYFYRGSQPEQMRKKAKP